MVQHAIGEAGFKNPRVIQLESFSGPAALSLARAKPLSEIDSRPIEAAEK